MRRSTTRRARTGAACLLALALVACGTRVDNGVTTAAGAGATATSGSTASAGATPGQATATTVSAGGTGGTGTSGTGTGATGGSGDSTGGTGTNDGGTGAGGATSGPATGTPIELGAVGTRSGLIGGALIPSWSALLAWQSYLNDHGGIRGRPVHLTIADDAGDAGKHASLVSQLIDQYHVVAFVGDQAPLTFSAGAPVLEQANIPAIGGDSTDPGWFSSPLAFPLSGSVPAIPIGLGKWGSANLTQKKVAIVYINEAAVAGQGADVFASYWTAGGGQVVARSGVSIAQPDFTSEVLQAKNAGADAVFVFMQDASCSRFFDTAARQQYHPVFLTIGCSLASIRGGGAETAGRTYVGGNGMTPPDGTPSRDAYVSAMQTYAPNTPIDEGLNLLGWLSGQLFEAAANRVQGDITSAALIDALHGLQDETLGGYIHPQSWPPGSHPPGQCGTVTLFDGTTTHSVTPDFVCA